MNESEFLFNESGFELIKSTSTAETLQLLLDGVSRNLLLDVSFPTHDKEGILFLEQLNRIKSGLNVVMFTAYPELSDAVKTVRDLMAIDYLAKPIPFDEENRKVFFNKLHSSFDNKRFKRKLNMLQQNNDSEKYRISKTMTILTFCLGVLFILGGIITALQTSNSETSITIFKQSIKTSSIGVAFVFLGAVFLIMIFKRILKLFK